MSELTARTGQLGQDSWDRTAGTGQLGHDSCDKSARIDCQNLQRGQDSWDRASRMYVTTVKGQSWQHSRNRISGTGRPNKSIRTGWLDDWQASLDRTEGIRRPGQGSKDMTAQYCLENVYVCPENSIFVKMFSKSLWKFMKMHIFATVLAKCSAKIYFSRKVSYLC